VAQRVSNRADAPASARARRHDGGGPEFARVNLRSHCEVGERLGQRLRLPSRVSDGLWFVFERWDGKGMPAGVAGERTAELLRGLGHEVGEHKLAHPQLLTTFTPRWAAGIRGDALSRSDVLEPRTQRMAGLGGRLGGRALRRSSRREATVAARLNAVFDQFDLVMTPTTAGPPPAADISRGAGAFRTFNEGSPYVCYTPTWNYVGQPAASIPAGFDSDGLPTAIQLAGPADSEPLIIALAAQLEAARPWRDHRPAEEASSAHSV
jgi:Asp-tRNA(Asn)/Glu-tRNA(Gln) amidotransferase A subunit family amidase